MAHHRLRRAALRRSAFVGHSVAVGGLAPAPARIPYVWLSPPLRFASDAVYTAAEVSGEAGDTGRYRDASAVDEYGEKTFTANLDTSGVADLTNLAHFTVTYSVPTGGRPPRQRLMAMTLVLNGRTADEQSVILGVAVGQRISILGAPTAWPEGASEQVVEGIARASGASSAAVSWVTTPVIGSEPGIAGPWFRLGTSDWSADVDQMPSF